MPYKYSYDRSNTIINEEDDRRKKLTDEEKEEIKKLYGKISQRKLAKKYGVSRSLVIFIGSPEKHTENLKRRKERGGGKIYYDREKCVKQKREFRRNKKRLYDEGRLSEMEQTEKRKCPTCKEWFKCKESNRIHCYECHPKESED